MVRTDYLSYLFNFFLLKLCFKDNINWLIYIQIFTWYISILLLFYWRRTINILCSFNLLLTIFLNLNHLTLSLSLFGLFLNFLFNNNFSLTGRRSFSDKIIFDIFNQLINSISIDIFDPPNEIIFYKVIFFDHLFGFPSHFVFQTCNFFGLKMNLSL